ncbi:DUF6196 family protein [Granulicella sp. S156]|jgi:hypothetical protein|uniref:DUF6196 family protein n=1 Tax=Granulicella sp. S156 TaxID=1747224 RepID=UPI00131CB6A2|nr:DUF6196 family protein [Granulicella sp. S156]
MYVSQETPEQIDVRLRRVIVAAELTWHEGEFAFYEFPVSEFPAQEAEHGLAFVRDEEVWSVLKAAGPEAAEPFGIFSFHFRDDMDNSGFVGWLASILKREIGTGVFVVCGQNLRRGGIFDYWGVPLAMRGAAVGVLNRLRQDPRG